MKTKSFDWKDVANAQFEKALALAVVLVLFVIMIAPKIDLAIAKSDISDPVLIPLRVDEPQKMEDIKVNPPVVELKFDPFATTNAEDLEKAKWALIQSDSTIFRDYVRQVKEEKPFLPKIYEFAPEVITGPVPVYPEFSKKHKITGTVVLDVEVYSDGSVGNITVFKSLSKGAGGLDEAAITAVKQWKFQPGTSGGHAVDCVVRIPLEFSLTKD